LRFTEGVDCWIGVVQERDGRLVRLAGRLSVAQVPELLNACAEAIPLHDRSVDLISAAGSLNYANLDLFFPEAARVLVPGGRLALKVVNGEPILADFRHADREERDGVVVTLSRAMTLEPPRMIERVSVSGSRGTGRYERRQRLYRGEEVSAAATRAGFTIAGVFADACGAVFEPATSPTMWVIGVAA
jgi:ubiquinone/menaquinone biosynthesis C-methylase UbiE